MRKIANETKRLQESKELSSVFEEKTKRKKCVSWSNLSLYFTKLTKYHTHFRRLQRRQVTAQGELSEMSSEGSGAVECRTILTGLLGDNIVLATTVARERWELVHLHAYLCLRQ